MDFLVLSPPVCTPAEPPAGAFLLSAALAGHGYEAGLLDLSLAFYHKILSDPELPGPSTGGAVNYLVTATDEYPASKHRSTAGVLHRKLLGFGERYPGWRLSLMDIAAPLRGNDPREIAALLQNQESPFNPLFEEVLDPILSQRNPKRILISLAYLSQLPAAIELANHMKKHGLPCTVGGSLINSLAITGGGLHGLEHVFDDLLQGDGSKLITSDDNHQMLSRLDWPLFLCDLPYLSARPIIPLTLSTGCYWRRCLFCPDREMPYHAIPSAALENFLAHLPPELRRRRPILHLLDSALPPGRLRATLPLFAEHQLQFYGFARPETALLADNLLTLAANSGLTMLQLGGESGSATLLARYNKGIDPTQTATVLHSAHELGIRTYLYLLFGLPGETDRDRAATLAFVEQNGSVIDFLNVSVFNLPRNCELIARAAEFGIAIDDFPEDGALRLYWPFTANGVSSRDDARQFLKQTFQPHPTVRRIALQTPRWLRAAHMALLKL